MKEETEPIPKRPEITLAIRSLYNFCRLPVIQINSLEGFSAETSRVGDDLYILLINFGTKRLFPSAQLNWTTPPSGPFSSFYELTQESEKGHLVLSGRKQGVSLQKWFEKEDINLNRNSNISIEIPASRDMRESLLGEVYARVQPYPYEEIYPLRDPYNPAACQRYVSLLQLLVRELLSQLPYSTTPELNPDISPE